MSKSDIIHIWLHLFKFQQQKIKPLVFMFSIWIEEKKINSKYLIVNQTSFIFEWFRSFRRYDEFITERSRHVPEQQEWKPTNKRERFDETGD